MTIEQFIQQAREIESKSTEGPWVSTDHQCDGHGNTEPCNIRVVWAPELNSYYPEIASFTSTTEQNLGDSNFIAHAKNTYKPLLDALTVAINNMESIDDEWPGELETRTDEEWKVIALVLMKGNRDSLAKIQTILGAEE